MSAQCLSEIEMAKAQRDYELKKATYDIEVNTRRAQADLAYQLQVRAAQCPRPLTLPPLPRLRLYSQRLISAVILVPRF